MATIGRETAAKYSRNRCPCKPCQVSKRKCDQAKPKCSRCRKLELSCEPSIQSRWRIKTSRDTRVQNRGQTSVTVQSSPNVEPEMDCQPSKPVTPAGEPEPIAENRASKNPARSSFGDATRIILNESAHNGNDGNGDSVPVAVQYFVDMPASTDEERPSRAPVSGISFEEFFPSDFTASHFDGITESSFPADFSFIIPDLHTPSLISSRFPSPPNMVLDHIDGTVGDRAANNVEETPFSLSDTESDTFSARIDDILRHPAGLTEPDQARCRTHLLSLWAYFKLHVAPSLTPFSTRADNPFLKYLTPRAETNRNLLIAVLYLAQTVKQRTLPDVETDCTEFHFLKERAAQVIQILESDTAVIPESLDDLGKTNHSQKENKTDSNHCTTDMVITLSTVLVFCMAFIADQDAARFVQHLEYAVIVCQFLFKFLSGNESFLYLAKLLGFMQNSLLFSTSGSINAPDYLSAALEFHDRHSDALRDIDGQHVRHTHFRDLDMFSGLSASMASTLHALGSLIKRKKVSLGSVRASDGETVRTFQRDVDNLEVRLRMHLSRLTQRCDASESRQTPTFQTASLTIYLNFYNEAIFWSIWTIFLTDLRDRSPAADPEVRAAAEHVLDACSEIPRQSAVAPLMLFPLMVGGMRAIKKVYREFVLNRLQSLRPVGLTDTQSLCTDLENWWQTDETVDSPMTFTQNVVF